MAGQRFVSKLFDRVSLLLLATAIGSVGCSSGRYEGYKNAPYSIRGQQFYPLGVEQALGYEEVGITSWYDENKMFGLIRGTTALGEGFRAYALAGAHRTLPLPCRVKVTNLENGRTARIRLNDRGPYVRNRMLDVTPRVASKLGFKEKGLTRVHIEVLSVGDGKWRRKR